MQVSHSVLYSPVNVGTHLFNVDVTERAEFIDNGWNLEFDSHELQIYEEVACMPPFQRRTLVLIGAQGVGRRSLKNRLLVLHPDRYGTPVPCEY